MGAVHTALSVGVEEDLLPLSALLHQRGLLHRIYEKGGRQVLSVEREEHIEEVQQLYRNWRSGALRIELSRRNPTQTKPPAGPQWLQSPVTLALIVLSVCGFGLVYLMPFNSLVGYLTFLPFQLTGDRVVFASMNGQYWRLITPVFLHFGWMHIVFNSLWAWDLGTRVEREMGHFNMLMLFLVIALVSNTSQFLYGGGGNFGGMSGVVYGLLGFSWVAPQVQPRWVIQPSPTIMLFMVGWLVLCMVGVIEVLGFGAIANAAHLGGLLCGAVLGGAFGLLSRLGEDRPL